MAIKRKSARNRKKRRRKSIQQLPKSAIWAQITFIVFLFALSGFLYIQAPTITGYAIGVEAIDSPTKLGLMPVIEEEIPEPQEAIIEEDAQEELIQETLQEPEIEPLTAPARAPAEFSIMVRVSQSYDDAEEKLSDNSMRLTSHDLELVRDGSNDQEIGIRFQNINIPQGATIDFACVEFEIDEYRNWDTDLIVFGEDSVNPDTFSSSDGDITNRTKTSALVLWDDVTDPDVNEKLQTPNISLIIQEIINKVNWAENNSLVIIINGSGKRVVESYDGESTAAPLLIINYSICTTSLANTSWSDWINISCLASDVMNQSRSRVQYDENNCGEVENTTITEYRATEFCDFCTPNLANTSWSDWINISCLATDLINQSRSRIQYDINNCNEIANQTITEYRITEYCDYCTPNLVNTSWSDWINISCLETDLINQSRSKTQYDLNNCGEINNQSFIEYRTTELCDFCIPNLVNITEDWTNISCMQGDIMNQTRTIVQYDSNNCNESNNQTIIEYRATEFCDYSAINSPPPVTGGGGSSSSEEESEEVQEPVQPPAEPEIVETPIEEEQEEIVETEVTGSAVAGASTEIPEVETVPQHLIIAAIGALGLGLLTTLLICYRYNLSIEKIKKKLRQKRIFRLFRKN